MGQRNGEADLDRLDWLELVRQVMLIVLQDPPAHPEFHALQHTFLSQTSHRDDFRLKLAALYEDWRSRSAKTLQRDLRKRPGARRVNPRTLATLVQAIFHGLAVQRAADPEAVKTRDVVPLCLDLLNSYLWTEPPPRNGRTKRITKKPKQLKPIRVRHERNGKP
jgi:hypothetical protein